MISIPTIDRNLLRHVGPPIATYGALVAALCVATFLLLADLFEQYSARNVASETLAQLTGRLKSSSFNSGTTNGSWPSGSPFLEGPTVTIASAALLQRVTTAITRVGGSVISSEIAPQEAQAKDGSITAVATFELELAAVQRLLYDIEAGMPFLFVKQLSIDTPTQPNERRRLKVRLAVSGQWLGAK